MKKILFSALFICLSLTYSQAQENPTPLFTINEVNDTTVLACPWGEVVFDASASIFDTEATFSSVIWDFGDGIIDTTSWPLTTHVYPTPYNSLDIYTISLTITDNNSNTSTSEFKSVIIESFDPFFECGVSNRCIDTSQYNTDVIIEQINLYNLLPHDIQFGLNYSVGITNITSPIIISGFEQEETITNIDQIDNLFINIEHTYIADLHIQLTCPNEQSFFLHQSGGGSTNLGLNSPDGQIEPGEGYDYWWSPDAILGAWSEEAPDYTILPSETYSSFESFDSLIGCPLNGVWSLEILDNWGGDDGWIFDWTLNFTAPVNTNTIYLPLEFVDEGGGIIIDGGNCTDDLSCPHENSIFFNFHPLPNLTINNISDTLFTNAGMDNYQWFLNGEILQNDTTNFIAPVVEGNFTVESSSIWGCTGQSETFNYSFDFIPEIALSLNGTVDTIFQFCSGEEIVIDGSASDFNENIASVIWNFGDGTSDISWPITSHIYENSGDFTIYLEITDNNNDITNTTIEVVIQPSSSPTISYSEGILLTEGEMNSYQWYLEGTILMNDTLPYIEVTDEGNYSVQVTNSFGCENISELFNYSTSSIEQGIENIFSVIAKDNKLTIISNIQIKTIRLYNMNGKLLYTSQSNTTKEYEISTKDFPSGIYLIVINNALSKKIVIESQK